MIMILMLLMILKMMQMWMMMIITSGGKRPGGLATTTTPVMPKAATAILQTPQWSLWSVGYNLGLLEGNPNMELTWGGRRTRSLLWQDSRKIWLWSPQVVTYTKIWWHCTFVKYGIMEHNGRYAMQCFFHLETACITDRRRKPPIAPWATTLHLNKEVKHGLAVKKCFHFGTQTHSYLVLQSSEP